MSCVLVIGVFYVIPRVIARRADSAEKSPTVERLYRGKMRLDALLGVGFAAVFGIIAVLGLATGQWTGAAIAGAAGVSLGVWGARSRRDG